MDKGKIKRLSTIALCFILLFSSVYTGYTVSNEDSEVVVTESNSFSDSSDTENYGEIDDGSHRLVSV